MSVSRRDVLGGAIGAASAAGLSSAAGAAPPPPPPAAAAAGGRFRPTWESLVAGYRAPDWFRDAKFGIWAHWSAQCVPEAGDWYAREMYLQGSRINQAHVAKYGHPSDVGFMEIENLWKAERWDPDRLLDLYARAGAKYFVALANHHDNFDAYDSKHHPWNSVRVGPRRDIVGTWAKGARQRGLRFGVSNHSAHAWHWYQPAYGYDTEGARKGERYDAWRLTKADGRGTWWEGLDPQALYAGRNMVMPDGVGSRAEADALHQRTDRIWDEGAPAANPAFTRNWTLRCRDLIDSYRPDLLYFDDTELPLDQAGLDIAAHYYNANMAWNDGRLEAVLNAKMMAPQRRMGLVEDVERGGKHYIETYPWQTDTCIGNWHYDRALYEADGYKTPALLVHTLCDIVSKNGNLLLNVPMRGDGTIDDKAERIVEALARWMASYGDAIYATRPWRIAGEGPAKTRMGMFSETGPQTHYGARDIRYAVKGDRLHAFVLGWPDDGVARLQLLGRDNPVGRGSVERVELPGVSAPLAFTRTGEALEVTLPQARRDPIGVALVISGRGLTA